MSIRVELRDAVLRLFPNVEAAKDIGEPVVFMCGWLAVRGNCLCDDSGPIPSGVLKKEDFPAAMAKYFEKKPGVGGGFDAWLAGEGQSPDLQWEYNDYCLDIAADGEPETFREWAYLRWKALRKK